ncbi:MAG: DUF4091 domain-containing protein [Ruminococcaceae bacterium]|nr:DUF4091 domain-containing protein [Oscillospiraceae bacterium]
MYMKKLLSAILAALTISGGVVSVFADDAGLTLTESSHLKVENGIVDMIDGTLTVGELKANFAGSVDVAGKTDDAAVCSDDAVTAGGETVKAIIWGDASKDGKITLTDATRMLQAIAKWSVDISATAGDVDRNDKLNLSDVSKLLRKLAKWDDISLGNVRMVFENTKLTAENESADLDLYFGSPLVKISRSNTKNTGKNAYKIKTARNETESCQFYVSSEKNMEGLTVQLSDFVHEYGEGTLTGEVFIHYYYKMEVVANCLIENYPSIEEYDYFPEALLPLADSFEVKAEQSQGFTVNVTAGKDAPAGMYRATLTVKDAEGNAVKTANIYTYVWDFTLPDTPYSKSSFGMSGFTIYSTLGSWYDKKWYNGDNNATIMAHYDFLLENNISCYQLPVSITDPRADAYMSDPRVTSFEVCGENLRFPDEDNWTQTMANWEKVQSNPVWAEKAHFYYVDEPQGESGAALVKAQHEYIREKLGTDDFDIIIPFGNSMADLNNNIDMLEFMKDYVDIHVPSSGGFMPNIEGNHYAEGLWTPRQAFNKFGESLPRLQAIGEDPDKELWWYVCVGPQFPYPNLFTSHQGIMTRVLWWQQFMFGPEGFLYWATQADWDKVIKCGGEFPTNGDGILMYLGAFFGYEQNLPVASWRLTQVRDGFDDFDYLKMAEELVGREEVMKLVTKLTTGVTTVKEDPALMEKLRDSVAELILGNSK